MRWDIDVKTTIGALLISGRRITIREVSVLTGKRRPTIGKMINDLIHEGWNIESRWLNIYQGKGKQKIYWLSGLNDPDVLELKGEKPFFGDSSDIYKHVEDLHIKRRTYWQNPENGVYDDMVVSFHSHTWTATNSETGEMIKGSISKYYVRELINVLEKYWIKKITFVAMNFMPNRYFLRYCRLKCIRVCFK